MSKKKVSINMLATIGILIGAQIILSRFLSIQAWNFRIGFSFVPLAIAGILYGPIGGIIVATISDVLGAILFSSVGPYFPGFTVTALLMGMVLGLFLHKKQDMKRIIGAVCINQLILSLLVNTLWISILYGSPYLPLLGTRIIQTMILVPVQIIVISQMVRVLSPIFKKKVLI